MFSKKLSHGVRSAGTGAKSIEEYQLVSRFEKEPLLREQYGVILRGRVRAECREAKGGPNLVHQLRLPLLFIAILFCTLVILVIIKISLIGKMEVNYATESTPIRIMNSKENNSEPRVILPVHKKLVFNLELLIRTNATSVELMRHAVQNQFRSIVINNLINKESVFRPLKQTINKQPPDCPLIPLGLKGKLDLTRTEKMQRVAQGGWWMPQNCSSRHVVAVIIPFRDRHSQLETLMEYLHPILQRQQINYRIFVVEQEGNDTYNKGVLMNAGFMTALSKPLRPGIIYHCFVFHDVDMLAEDDRNLYTCPQQPRHMSVAVNELKYKLPYRELVGGVFAIRTDHFLRVNGYSNLYWGWGGEDDDMGCRVMRVLFFISRPPDWIGRYTMIKHKKRLPLAWVIRNGLSKSLNRFKYDGLNTVQYKLLSFEELPLYTRILVDVGHPPNSIRMIQLEDETARNETL